MHNFWKLLQAMLAIDDRFKLRPTSEISTLVSSDRAIFFSKNASQVFHFSMSSAEINFSAWYCRHIDTLKITHISNDAAEQCCSWLGKKQKKMADDNKEVEKNGENPDKISNRPTGPRFNEILDAKYKYFRWRPYLVYCMQVLACSF